MHRWEQLENYLIRHPGLHFNAAALAKALKIDRPAASALIQSHLTAQRGLHASTQYVLSRRGRTRAAVWHAGVRSTDAKALTRQCFDDMAVKVHEALMPDLHRMAVLNPRAVQLTEAIEKAFVANLNLLEASLP